LSTSAAGAGGTARWDVAYEWKAVALLAVSFGLVGLDRMVLAPLFPFMMKDLHLNYQDLGNLVGILGIFWGLSAFLLGGLSDRLGRRKVLVPAIVVFSLLSWLSGVATGLASLLVIRSVMGVAEGAVASTGVAICTEASYPPRRGINQGFFQCAFALLGGALAPVLATQMLSFTTWRNVFLIVGVPGLIVAILVAITIREPATIGAHKAPGFVKPSFRDIFSHRNVGLGMITLVCAMTGVFVMGAMIPTYLLNYLKLSPQEMGFVASAAGFGGFLGQFSLPAISDLIGRKMAVLGAFVLAAIFLWAFAHTGAGSLPLLFVLLFGASMFNFGALAVIAGPLAAEAAPLGMIGSVSGLVIGAGEVFGGGVAPSIAGAIAQNYGLQYILYFALGGQVLGLALAFFLRETAPGKVGAAAVEAAAPAE
jgi:predicted MFS family arabinose efflux permease